MIPFSTSRPRPSSASRSRLAAGALLSSVLALLCAVGASARQPASQEMRVVSSSVLVEGGGRVDWSKQGDRIAFDRAGTDGLLDLWIHELDAGGERCLTCGTYEFRHANALNPEWSPDGEWLVFQRQDNAEKLELGEAEALGPERGLWSDVWIIRSDGKGYWQLTQLAAMGSAALDPHVSFEGDRVVWSERIKSREGAWGVWQLRSGALEVKRGVPRLKKLERHKSDELEGLVVSHGFLPDDRSLLFSAERPGRSRSLDIGVLDPDSGEVTLLTRSAAGADGYAAVAPRAPLIAFSSQALGKRGPAPPGPDPEGTLPAGEVWLMKLDGSEKRPLTRFNDADSPETLGRTWVGDLAWSPEGDRLAVQVVSGVAEGRPAIVVLDLEITARAATD